MSQTFTEQEGRAWVQWRKEGERDLESLVSWEQKAFEHMGPATQKCRGHALVFQQVNGSSGSAYTGQSWQGADSLCPALNVCL